MKTDDDLQLLLMPEFEVSVLSSTPAVLRMRLHQSEHICRLLGRYDQGVLSEDELRSFVNDLLRQHCSPEHFPYQTALAAIAVLLEHRYSAFAEEYLGDLSRVHTARMAIASRVARLCCASRKAGICNEIRVLAPLAAVPHRRLSAEQLDGYTEASIICEVAEWRN